MAIKTIPELDEIDVGDLTVDQLMVLDSGLATFKLRISTLMEFLGISIPERVEDAVTWDGTEVTHTYTGLTSDVRDKQWTFSRAGSPEKQLVCEFEFPDDTSVSLTFDLPLDAGTYILKGK